MCKLAMLNVYIFLSFSSAVGRMTFTSNGKRVIIRSNKDMSVWHADLGMAQRKAVCAGQRDLDI